MQKWWPLLLLLVLMLAAYGLLRPVCVPIPEAALAQFDGPLGNRSDRDFNVKVFQFRDGQWHQCKAWISRQLFF